MGSGERAEVVDELGTSRHPEGSAVRDPLNHHHVSAWRGAVERSFA